MSELTLQLSGGISVIVPASLNSITAFVLLEQEAWFEKEVAFLKEVLRPGMTAIDIGANLGVYSLAMARLVGPSGKVFAYEPGSASRALLLRSQQLNGCDNLQVLPFAVSDGAREGRLSQGEYPECDRLCSTGEGEVVQVISLDLEDARVGWEPPAFVKLDAEGEEENILRGGRTFFERHSPLVLFEVLVGTTVNESLRTAFPAMGYGVYRLLPGAPLLVPVWSGDQLDDRELNLFAARPDRASALAEAGLLVTEQAASLATAGAADFSLDRWSESPFGPAFVARFPPETESSYRKALGAYAEWRSPNSSPAKRWAALESACSTLTELCARAATPARLSTLARAAHEAGHYSTSLQALHTLIAAATKQKLLVEEPFWPACPRYDALVPEDPIDEWFIAAAVEQFERSLYHASCFGGSTPQLDWLCQKPFAPTEMIRRQILASARTGRKTTVPQRLRTSAPDHLNAAVWRAGLVPNTQV